MKNDNRHRGRRPLKKLIFRNYAIISGLVFTAFVLALVIADLFVERYLVRMPDFAALQGAQADETFPVRYGHLLDEYGGWFEIVDETGAVVSVTGTKKDAIFKYDSGEVYARLDILRNEGAVEYHAFPISDPNGAAYTLLWKIPGEWGILYSATGVFILVFAFLLLIALYVYTHFSVRPFKKPLQQITEGIREMESFNYEKRLHFSAEMEFAEIRDAFNQMAERLERTSAEKDAVERHKRSMLLHLSHDLKTPVTSILGYSQLMLDSPELKPEQRHKYMTYIHNKSQYMKELIQNLFALAQLEDRQFRLQLENVNLTKWLQEQLAEFYPEIEEQGFELHASIPQKPLYIRMDRVYMQRVIANLIGNALKFNPAGTQIIVSCIQQDDRIVLLIGDTGVGVQTQIRNNVFDPYVRGTDSHSDSSGIGLDICRKIISLHQGTIELTRDDTCSTLFRIALPGQETSGLSAV